MNHCQLRVRSQQAVSAGPTKTVDILDKLEHFLQDGFNSDREPLDLRFLLPSVPGGTQLEPFSVKFVLGASRALAALIIAEIVVSMGVSPADFEEDDRLILEWLCYITCTYEPCSKGVSELVARAVKSKMSRRPSKAIASEHSRSAQCVTFMHVVPAAVLAK